MVVEDARGTPLNVGRKTRSISTALRRALLARDGGCRYPGCTHRRYVDGHHVEHWTHGGVTSLSNVLLLCSVHALVHEGGFRVVGDGAGARFFAPDGNDVPATGIPPAVKASPPPAPLPATLWNGDPVDYDAAVAYLC